VFFSFYEVLDIIGYASMQFNNNITREGKEGLEFDHCFLSVAKKQAYGYL
jgi:hypothetical protein